MPRIVEKFRYLEDLVMQSTTSRSLLTVRQFSERHPAFSQGSLRNLIFLGKPRETSRGVLPGNGFDRALVRMGKKILIDEQLFFEWLEAQHRAGSEPLGKPTSIASPAKPLP